MSETTIDPIVEAETEPAAGLEPAEAAGEVPEVSALDVQLLRRLADQARDQGLELTGDGGLLQQLTRVFLESALEGEMDAHLGYPKHDSAGDNSGNSRRRPPGQDRDHRGRARADRYAP